MATASFAQLRPSGRAKTRERVPGRPRRFLAGVDDSGLDAIEFLTDS